MECISVRWRPSGGRGEFEYVPANSLAGREIHILFDALDIVIPAEVKGVYLPSQGKPRLRKFDSNNRQKLHLPQLVMAVARLPEPRREDHALPLAFPLENKSFVMDAMDFDVIDDDGINITLSPLRVSILHSDFKVDLADRISALAEDINNIESINAKYPDLAKAVMRHGKQVMGGVNSVSIRKTADEYISLQSDRFGMTNSGSVSSLMHFEALPPAEEEYDITGKEGRILTRIHVYKERDRAFSKKVKEYYKSKNNGNLSCVACGLMPDKVYSDRGDRCIEAHHKIPIEEIQPDSIVRIQDMAIVCASCHRVIHSRKPCLTIEEVQALRSNVT